MKIETLFEPHEFNGAFWIKLKEYLEKELDALRRKNDADLSDIETARLRGRIQMIRSLVALETPAPPQASGEL